MKLSIHTAKGKLSKEQAYLLGSDWINIEAEWQEVFDIITIDGNATCAELKSDRRTADQFVSRELIMVDIDDGMTFDDLFADAFYNEYGAGFYTTPSHADDNNPRFRIMFRTEEPIMHGATMAKLYRGLLSVYNKADKQCKDPTRLFYGTPNAKYKEITAKVLPMEMINKLVEWADELDDKQLPDTPANTHEPLDDADKQHLLDTLREITIPDRETWMRIGFGLKHEGFTLNDFIYATNEKDYAEAKRVWTGKRDGKVCTIGTVIYFINQHSKGFKKAKATSTDMAKVMLQKLKDKQNEQCY
jgi:hypothetical protein